MIKILKHQAEFLKSNAPSTGLVAGFGSGKSIVATLKSIEKLKSNPGITVGYYLPTHSLIKSIAFKNFNHYFNEMGISYNLNGSDFKYTTPIGNVILRSLTRLDLIIGYETAYAVIDEADVLTMENAKAGYKAVVARNRQKMPDDSYNSVDMVSTPEGFKFLYEYYVKEASDRRKLIKANTLDNPFLPKSYIENLYDTYSEKELKAYMAGEFVNLTAGTVYSDYDYEVNTTDRVVQENDTLHIGMDFNITNMAAVIHVIEDNIPYAVGEACGVYDTFQMIRLFKDKYPNHNIIIYPDASGNSRNTSGESDHNLLRQAGFKVFSPKKNPNVKDRITTANMMFRKGYKVNSNQCPEYSQALMQLGYKNGEPDKGSGLDHVTDAGTYFIYFTYKQRNAKVLI